MARSVASSFGNYLLERNLALFKIMPNYTKLSRIQE